jgi:hypothetical protein
MSTYCPKEDVYVDSLYCVGCDHLADSRCTYESAVVQYNGDEEEALKEE